MNAPLVVLDIDQDFLFSPILSGTIDEVQRDLSRIEIQRQVVGLGDITRVFRPYIPVGTPILHATNHDEVGKVLRKSGLQNILLYHLDAHTDIDDESLGANSMSMSDWISVTADLYSEVYWVLSPADYATTEGITRTANPPMQTYSLDNVPLPPKAIDLVFWTDSPGWCPQSVDLFSIFNRLIQY